MPLAIPKSLQRESKEKRRGTNSSPSKLVFLSRFSNLLRWSGLPIAQVPQDCWLIDALLDTEFKSIADHPGGSILALINSVTFDKRDLTPLFPQATISTGVS